MKAIWLVRGGYGEIKQSRKGFFVPQSIFVGRKNIKLTDKIKFYLLFLFLIQVNVILSYITTLMIKFLQNKF